MAMHWNLSFSGRDINLHYIKGRTISSTAELKRELKRLPMATCLRSSKQGTSNMARIGENLNHIMIQL